MSFSTMATCLTLIVMWLRCCRSCPTLLRMKTHTLHPTAAAIRPPLPPSAPPPPWVRASLCFDWFCFVLVVINFPFSRLLSRHGCALFCSVAVKLCLPCCHQALLVLRRCMANKTSVESCCCCCCFLEIKHGSSEMPLFQTAENSGSSSR